MRRRRPSARILVIHLARGMALGRGGIDTRFWLDAALLPGGTWPLAGASKNTALRLTARLTQSFWVEHMVSLRALSFCDDQPCRRRGGGCAVGQASLRGSLPQASSRTDRSLPHSQRRANTSASFSNTCLCWYRRRGRRASRTRTIGEAKKALQTGEIGHRIWMRRVLCFFVASDIVTVASGFSLLTSSFPC